MTKDQILRELRANQEEISTLLATIAERDAEIARLRESAREKHGIYIMGPDGNMVHYAGDKFEEASHERD